MVHRLSLAAVLLLVGTACGGDDTPGTTAASGTTQPGATSTTTTEATATTTTTTPAEPFLPGLGLESITQTTPVAGGGPRPLLSWEPVDGAAAYTVVVFDGEGTPWWSWRGEATEVFIGGFETSFEMGGPRAGPGVTWVVFAYDAEGSAIGVSEQRPLGE